MLQALCRIGHRAVSKPVHAHKAKHVRRCQEPQVSAGSRTLVAGPASGSGLARSRRERYSSSRCSVVARCRPVPASSCRRCAARPAPRVSKRRV